MIVRPATAVILTAYVAQPAGLSVLVTMACSVSLPRAVVRKRRPAVPICPVETVGSAMRTLDDVMTAPSAFVMKIARAVESAIPMRTSVSKATVVTSCQTVTRAAPASITPVLTGVSRAAAPVVSAVILIPINVMKSGPARRI